MYPAKVEPELYFLVVHGSLKVKKKLLLLFCVHTAFVSLLTTSPCLSQCPPCVHTTFGYGCVLVVE